MVIWALGSPLGACSHRAFPSYSMDAIRRGDVSVAVSDATPCSLLEACTVWVGALAAQLCVQQAAPSAELVHAVLGAASSAGRRTPGCSVMSLPQPLHCLQDAIAYDYPLLDDAQGEEHQDLQQLKDMLMQCLQIDVRKRTRVIDLLERHPFLRQSASQRLALAAAADRQQQL